MYDPFAPQMQTPVPGVPTPVPGVPGAVPPVSGTPGAVPPQGALSSFRSQLMNWRNLRPARPDTGGMDPSAVHGAMLDWRGQLQDWHQQLPQHGFGSQAPGVPQAPGDPTAQQMPQQMPSWMSNPAYQALLQRFGGMSFGSGHMGHGMGGGFGGGWQGAGG